LRDLSLCHWVVNVGELSSGAPKSTGTFVQAGLRRRDDRGTEPESMPRVSVAATKVRIPGEVARESAMMSPTIPI
jgi:hypothetical protein